MTIIDIPVKRTEKSRCGAKTRRGTPCQHWALDNGRCRLHGGRDVDPKPGVKVSGRPPTHGIYSKYLKGTLTDRTEEYLRDPNFLSLKDEIALSRALLSKVAERIKDEGEIKDDDTDAVRMLVESIRRLNETYTRIEAQRRFALTPDEVLRVVRAVVGIIRKHVDDDRIYNTIKNEVAKIKV